MRKKQAGLIIALIVMGLFTIFPFYLTIVNSLKYNLQMIESIWFFDIPLHFDNYANAIKEIWGGILNSIFYTLAILAVTLVISSFAGYSFSVFHYPGKDILYFAIIMFLMIPGFVTLIPQFMLIKDMRLLNTRAGLILPVIATTSVMPVMFFRNYFEGLPKELFEAARVEDAGDLKIFLSIVVPLSKSIFGTVAIMTGLTAWNNYIWPLVAANDRKIMPVILQLQYISQNAKEGMGPVLAGYVIASVPIVILFTVATKPFIQGVTAGAVKL